MTPRLLLFLLLACLLASPATGQQQQQRTTTRSVPAIRLELTIRRGGGGRRLLLLRGSRGGELPRGLELDFAEGEGPADRDEGDPHGAEVEAEAAERSLRSDVDATIQRVAEAHLSQAYASAFDLAPVRVRLTVVPDESSSSSNGDGQGGSVGSDIYVRASYLAGVATFPVASDAAPSAREIEAATLAAFDIPGAAGEAFLDALKEEGEREGSELGGLLLVGAESAEGGYYGDNDYDSGGGSEGTADEYNQPPAPSNSPSMNVWAVAAVAALGAMFLVIVLCTSILYCDWRKRRERRERKRRNRALAAATAAAGNQASQAYGYGGGYGGGRSNGHKRSGKNRAEAGPEGIEVPYHAGPPQIRRSREPGLQIVVPAPSGETEEVVDSPSTRDSKERKHADDGAPSPDGSPAKDEFNPGQGHSQRGSLIQRVKSARRSLPRPKSKAAGAKLAELHVDEEARVAGAAGGTGGIPPMPEIDDPTTDDEGDLTHVGGNSLLDADRSVGEDTTVLYPSMHRNRTHSKDVTDAASDFDGYSMDGMSAVVGDGFSQVGGSVAGGSAGGGGGGGGFGGVAPRGGSDHYYAGEVPRDFDSVWDDESKAAANDRSVDLGSSGYPASSAGEAERNATYYGDLTKNLDELVEREYERAMSGAEGIEVGEEGGSRGGGESLHKAEESVPSVGPLDLDSESESGADQRGAFTLELLGGGNSSRGGDGPSKDADDDSILGDLYRDDANSSADRRGDEEDEEDDDVRGGAPQPGSGDSVDSETPSWAGHIQSALRRSRNVFRQSSSGSGEESGEGGDRRNGKELPTVQDEAADASSSASSKESRERRTKDKFVSSLHGGGDEGSVGSRGSDRSRGSRKGSSGEGGGGGGAATKGAKDAKGDTALGLTNSMEEEVDEDPAAMIDNINSMLSECREILDTSPEGGNDNVIV